MARPSPNAGRSIYEIVQDELDVVIGRLMMDGEPDDEMFRSEPNEEELAEWLQEWQHWGETRGQAQGLSYALAAMRNPYQMDVPAIKREAMDRWKESQKK